MCLSKKTRRNDYYLDVSDFIISNPRQGISTPRRTPLQIPIQLLTNDVTYYFFWLISPPKNYQLTYLFLIQLIQMITPINSPLIIGIQGVELSPYFNAHGPRLDIEFYDFTLQTPSQVVIYQLENEENHFLQSSESQWNNQFQYKFSKKQIMGQKPVELQEGSVKNPNYQQIETSHYNFQYFNKKLSELKKMKAPESQIQQFVFEYMTKQNFMNQDLTEKSIEELITIALKNLRPIGHISWLQRKLKVDKYLQKKKGRVWKKKINYDCRKKVADNRLRVKGKFVTKEQHAIYLEEKKEGSEDQLVKQLIDQKNATKSAFPL